MSAEARVRELGLILPEAPEPIAAYVTAASSGNILYTAGHGPRLADGSLLTGRVGVQLDTQAAREAARVVGLGLLATLRRHLGSLDRVSRVLKVLGMVNAIPEFTEHPAVIDGCSELFLSVFGKAGRHARSAVGVASLPGNIPVEIEAVVEIDWRTHPAGRAPRRTACQRGAWSRD